MLELQLAKTKGFDSTLKGHQSGCSAADGEVAEQEPENQQCPFYKSTIYNTKKKIITDPSCTSAVGGTVFYIITLIPNNDFGADRPTD